MEIATNIERLSKSAIAITYADDSGTIVVVGEELAKPTRRWDYNAGLKKLPAPTGVLSASPSSAFAPLRSFVPFFPYQHAPSFPLAEFNFNCSPPRIVKVRTDESSWSPRVSTCSPAI
jgi:hypothetical protein